MVNNFSRGLVRKATKGVEKGTVNNWTYGRGFGFIAEGFYDNAQALICRFGSVVTEEASIKINAFATFDKLVSKNGRREAINVRFSGGQERGGKGKGKGRSGR